MHLPRWEEFEDAHWEHPNKFIKWATEPFRSEHGGVWRIAILQPWPTAGLIWQFCSVDIQGKVSRVEASFARSAGSFYDALPHECNARQSGNAIVDATNSAQEKMRWFLKS
jgi:hypothetical protein